MALPVPPVPPYSPAWADSPNQEVTGTFVEGQQNTTSITSLREPAQGITPVKAEGSEARGLDTRLIPLHPASSNYRIDQNNPNKSYEYLKPNKYHTSLPAATRGIARLETEASKASGINVTVPKNLPVALHPPVSIDAPSRDESSPFVEEQEDTTTGTPLPEVVERTTLVKMEAPETRGRNTTVPQVQPAQRILRKQEQNIGGYDNEVLLRCCLRKKIYYEYGAFAKFWTIVQLDFQLETRRTLENARQTVLDLLKKRRMERAEEQRTGRAPYPQVLSKIRPLLDEFQKIMDGGITGNTTGRRPTGGFALRSGTHVNKDHSANPVEISTAKVNKNTARKRSFAKILDGTEAAKEITQRPFKRRVMAEASKGIEDDANSGFPGSRTEDDASSDLSDLPSANVSETSEEIGSLLSALDEDDTGGEEASKESFLESSEDPDDDSSGCGQKWASAPWRMGHRREPAAELVGLKQSVMKILNSASSIIDTIQSLKTRRSVD